MEHDSSHELDTIVVANIDIDCDDVDPDHGYSHRDYFEARWEKNPYRIRPGETRRLPRFIANHFAKHLTDHILLKEGERAGKEFMIRDERSRDRVLGEVLLQVDEHFMSDLRSDSQKTAERVKKLNPDLPSGDDLDSAPLEQRYKRSELFKIAKAKHLKLTGGETKKELAEMIRQSSN